MTGAPQYCPNSLVHPSGLQPYLNQFQTRWLGVQYFIVNNVRWETNMYSVRLLQEIWDNGCARLSAVPGRGKLFSIFVGKAISVCGWWMLSPQLSRVISIYCPSSHDPPVCVLTNSLAKALMKVRTTENSKTSFEKECNS